MSSAESYLDLLDSIVCSAERLCEGELCCLGHGRKESAFCLFYEIYHRVDHPMIPSKLYVSYITAPEP